MVATVNPGGMSGMGAGAVPVMPLEIEKRLAEVGRTLTQRVADLESQMQQTINELRTVREELNGHRTGVGLEQPTESLNEEVYEPRGGATPRVG